MPQERRRPLTRIAMRTTSEAAADSTRSHQTIRCFALFTFRPDPPLLSFPFLRASRLPRQCSYFRPRTTAGDSPNSFPPSVDVASSGRSSSGSTLAGQSSARSTATLRIASLDHSTRRSIPSPYKLIRYPLRTVRVHICAPVGRHAISLRMHACTRSHGGR